MRVDEAARLRQVTLTQMDIWRDATNPGSVADHARAPTPEPNHAESEYQLNKFNEKATYVTKKGEIIDLCSSTGGTSSEDDHSDSVQSEM